MEFSTPFSLNNVNQTSATMECMMYQLILESYPAITDTNISVIPISKGDKLWRPKPSYKVLKVPYF